MKKSLLKNKKGQTAVEYVLMLAAVSAIAFSVMNIVRDKIFEDADNCTETSTSLICMFQGLYDRRDFVYFTIIRTF